MLGHVTYSVSMRLCDSNTAAFRASQARGWKQSLENIRQLPLFASGCLLFLATLRFTRCLDLHSLQTCRGAGKLQLGLGNFPGLSDL